ncbi:MAG: carboxypeptidase-like regulatory domain-containing protein [Acidobacteria bacterium]|nr:carboxypeptidase-like regulatory domain-containing protein [Acidobacteriota bacterium]
MPRPVQSNRGTVLGRVSDAGGFPILASIITAGRRGRIQDEGYAEDGNYRVDLPPGVYDFTVKSDGFRTLRRRGVRVRPGSTVKLDFTLRRNRTRTPRR